MSTRSQSTASERFMVLIMRLFLVLLGILLVFVAVHLFPGSDAVIAIVAILFVLKAIDFFAFRAIQGAAQTRQKRSSAAEASGAGMDLFSALSKDSYLVFHDVAIPQGSIDHLVLSHTGQVVIIETASYVGNVEYDGRALLRDGKPFDRDLIADVQKKVATVRERWINLAHQEMWVCGILCFPKSEVTIVHPCRELEIVDGKGLVNAISQRRSNDSLSEWLWENVDTLISKLKSA